MVAELRRRSVVLEPGGNAAPAASEPGFKIDPAGRHTITLPARSLPLWAWAPSRSRLVTAPVAGRGVAPTATLRMTVDAMPRMLAEPDGWGPGRQAILRVVGAGPVSYLFAENQPDGDGTLPPLEPGTDLPLVNDGGEQKYMAVDPALSGIERALSVGRSALGAVIHGAPGWRRASR